MDDRSVTRAPASPTRAIVADEAFCAQAAAVLLCEEEQIRDAFVGEPVEEVLEMVRWAIKHLSAPPPPHVYHPPFFKLKRAPALWSAPPASGPGAR